ncbi:MAG TPA: type II secretion system minor pseudopilin GspI [Candidatus Binatia bacterium]|nr:type II secretion system minor pseudopilin GspI [Candidatus Binatia bacterium]
MTRPGSRGFTLIEILVAVAVLAFAMGAIISGMARYASNAAYLRDKTLAAWIAHNRLTEVMIEKGFPDTGDSDGDVEMAGAKWRWLQKVEATPDPNVRRIEVKVRLADAKEPIGGLVGFKTKPSS